MEDTFRVRVDKTFNSLPSSSSSSSSSPFPQTLTLTPSLWSLTDDELEKRPWTREPLPSTLDLEPYNSDDDDDEGPFPSSFDRLLSKLNQNFAPNDQNPNSNPNPNLKLNLEDDLRELDDDDDEKEEEEEEKEEEAASKGGKMSEVDEDEDEDELDVRKSIGMDATLDLEEEEDEYDKVAVGSEKTGDRLYMSDVSDYIPEFNSYNEIPNTFKEASRDPRANHLAAKLRLKEDAEAARSFNSLHVSEQSEASVSNTPNNSQDQSNSKSILKRKENQIDSESEESVKSFNSLHVVDQTEAPASVAINSSSKDQNDLKSILKRKEDQMGSKTEKKVRFDASCKRSDNNESEDKDISTEMSLSVPDYIRNPSRYTHYIFESSDDMNEESNSQAYMDFLNMPRKSKQSDLDEVPADLSKPVVFNQKKKSNQTKEITMEETMRRNSLPVSFASEYKEENEITEMELDEQVNAAVNVASGKRTARQYRSKQSSEPNESEL